MTTATDHWCSLYRNFKYKAIYLDIETTHFDGPISVLSLCKMTPDDSIHTTQLTRSKDLNTQALQHAFADCQLIVTYNGIKHDLPKIDKEFPGAIPANIPVLDLYLLSRSLGMNTGLKTLEKTFNIKCPNTTQHVPGNTHQLWHAFSQNHDWDALHQLMQYNYHDAKNLIQLANTLTHWAYTKILATRYQIQEAINASIIA